MQAIKTALASFGMSGKVFQAPFLDYHAGFELSKILQRNSHSAKQIYPQVQIVGQYEDILQDADIELVIINTPNHLHYPMALQALEAGKNVLVEKPITTTALETQQLIEAAEKRNLLLYPFQNRRWDGDFLTVKKIIEQGILGKIKYFEANWDRYRNYVTANTWKESDEAGTGMLYDLGSHLIDQILTLFGQPQRVLGSLRSNRLAGKIVDFFSVKLFYPNFEVSLGGNYLARIARPRFLLQGELGSFVKYGLDGQEDALKRQESLQNPQWGEESPDNWGDLHTEIAGIEFKGKIKSEKGNYLALFQDLYAAIRDGATPAVQPMQALWTMQVIEAIQLSHQQRKWIDL
jgi:scyllo-inositol 2-dehydrogenase (NADP+)